MDNDIKDELAKLVRRVDSVQKSVDILNADRNILEDIVTRLSAVEQALHLNKDHQDEMNKNIKQEIREAGAIVENTVHEIKNTIGEKTVIVKSKTDSIFAKLKKLIQKNG